jgi:hypothetical protein
MKMGQPFSLAVRFFTVNDSEMMIKFLLPPLLLLSSCGPNPNDSGPGGVSVEDARALDAAAENLDSGTIVPVMQQKSPDKPKLPESAPGK